MYIKDMNFIDNLNNIYLNNISRNEINDLSDIISLFNNFNLKNEIQFNFNKYINKHERFKVEKTNSTIFAILINNKKFLDYYNININKALRAIMTLACTLKNQKCDIRLADRYICENSDLSRSQLYALIRFLDNHNIIKYIFDKGEKRVKALSLILNDPLIDRMNNELIRGKISAYDKCMNLKNPSIYYNESTYITKKNHLKQNIISITLAYNELLNIYSESKREDIKYVIIPIPLIAYVLHVKERKIMRAVKNLTKSNWLKPHDLVYVDTFGMDHYFNESYKWFNKKDWKDVILENNHPIVNDYSYIIFNNHFKNSKWYKTYKNHRIDMLQEVKSIILAYNKNNKYFLKKDKYFNNEDNDDTLLSREIDKHTQITDFTDKNEKLFEQLRLTQNYKAIETLMNGQTQIGNVIDFDIIRKISNYRRQSKPYMLSDKQIETFNISDTAKRLKYVIKLIEDKDNENEEGFHLKYYSNLVTKLQNHLKQMIKNVSTFSIKFAIKVKNNLIKSGIGQDIDYEYEPIKDLILHYPTTNEINKAYFLQKSLNKKHPESSDNIKTYQKFLNSIDKEFDGNIPEHWLDIYNDNVIRKRYQLHEQEYKDISSKKYIKELEELFI